VLIFGADSRFNQYFSSIDKREQKVPFRPRQTNTCKSNENSKEEMYGNLARLTVGRTPATVANKIQMTPLGKRRRSKLREPWQVRINSILPGSTRNVP
jgi:hypothetical protein